MSTTKRVLTIVVVLTAALGSLGIVSASTRTPDQTALKQEEGGAWLGVAITDTDDGVQVVEVVRDSPADDAGLIIGDVILAVDDTTVASADMLIDVIQGYEPGDDVTLLILRRDEEREIEATLGARPDEVSAQPARPHVGRGVLNFLGLTADMTDEGLLIDEIEPDSPLADKLEAGDVIVEINGEPVTDLNARDLLGVLQGDALALSVLRDDEMIDVEIEMPDMGVGPMFGGTGAVSPAAAPTRLGVRFMTLTPELAEEMDLAVEQGALINEVYEDTPAAEAGLQEGDIIIAVEDDVLDEERTLADRLIAYEEGDVVTLTVIRDGEEIEIDATLGPAGPGGVFFGEMPIWHWQQGQGHGPGWFRWGEMDPENWPEMFPFLGPDGEFDFDFEFDTPLTEPETEGPSA
ncbi:MAG: PDZ domain-containing protein [Anaerolineae bacterium]|nr:PDZ domain-containing protein [Anaerolineae bacterium]